MRCTATELSVVSLLQQPLVAITDATHALSLHSPVNRHAESKVDKQKNLWFMGIVSSHFFVLVVSVCGKVFILFEGVKMK